MFSNHKHYKLNFFVISAPSLISSWSLNILKLRNLNFDVTQQIYFFPVSKTIDNKCYQFLMIWVPSRIIYSMFTYLFINQLLFFPLFPLVELPLFPVNLTPPAGVDPPLKGPPVPCLPPWWPPWWLKFPRPPAGVDPRNPWWALPVELRDAPFPLLLAATRAMLTARIRRMNSLEESILDRMNVLFGANENFLNRIEQGGDERDLVGGALIA